MRVAVRMWAVLLAGLALAIGSVSDAQQWPQWRGPHRDAKATAFQAPQSWPDQLQQQWKVDVGDGVSTPALVDQRLYVFARQQNEEVMRCLDAATGAEIWQDRYPAEAVRGPASRFSGPRSSPAVAEGKVVALGVQGVLSCWDASSGQLLWRKDDLAGTVPRFNSSSSPLVVRNLCIAQVGDERSGAIVAYDLSTGEERWKSAEEGTAYGSPVLMDLGGMEVIVAPTSNKLVALNPANGDIQWEMPYSPGRYNAATPIVAENQILIYAGPERGTSAAKLTREGDTISAEPLWSNTDNSLVYNTPVVKDGLIYGISNLNSLFCVDIQTGETRWNAPLGAASEDQGRRGPAGRPAQGEGQRGRGGRRGGRGGRGGPGGGGFGSVVDAGPVLFALIPTGQLVVFEPSGDEFKQVASYQIADGETYAYPVLAGDRVYIKAQDTLILASF